MALVLRRLAVVAGALLVPFAVASALGGWDAAPPVPRATGLGVVVVEGLLTVDVLLPAPSSAVIVAAGAAFGPVVGGLAGACGVVAGAVVGHAVGGRVRGTAAGAANDRARALVLRWGPTAVVATRPVPLLAESVSIAAGSLGMARRRFVVAALGGALPTGLGLAHAGARGADALDGSGLVAVLGATAALAAVAAVVVGSRSGQVRAGGASGPGEGRARPEGGSA